MLPQVNIRELDEYKFNLLTKNKSKPITFKFSLKNQGQYHPKELVNLDPDVQVRVRVYVHDRKTTPRSEWTTYCNYTTMSIDEYVCKVADGTAEEQGLYLALFEVSEHSQATPFRDHLSDLSLATGLLKSPTNDINLWLSPPGHVEGLHFDGDDGTLLQYHGEKTVTLVAPKYSRDLYPFPPGGGLPVNFSRVDFSNINKNQFPRACLAKENSITTKLTPGEGIYIPAGWWHQVAASNHNEGVVSINRFWSTKHIPLLYTRPRVSITALLSKLITSFARR